jgi:hypothetical protein
MNAFIFSNLEVANSCENILVFIFFGENMAEEFQIQSKIRRRNVVTVRLSDEEHSLIQACSKRAELAIADWIRQKIQAAIQAEREDPQLKIFLNELVMQRLLLLNALHPLIYGEQYTPEKFKEMIKELHKLREQEVSKMLAKIRNEEE